MITFLISIVALILGYFIYGKVVDKVFGPDGRQTPAVRINDGVDYVAMPTWKVYMIQFLNIAGTGPIFGAIMGMWFGPAAFLWIVFGCIFGGAVHDYLSGMLSMRNDGAGLPTMIGKYLGSGTRKVMITFTALLLVMVGAVFVYSPAIILEGFGGDKVMWMVIIFVYYLIATMMPIDKIIGKIYPLFAISLIFMALALFVALLIKMPQLPELWNMGNMESWQNSLQVNGQDGLGLIDFLKKNPLLPCMFITIACGAVSGFHATQSPLMARCLKSERLARPVFYGAMITEGIVALIWASVSSYFFYYGGWKELISEQEVTAFVSQVGGEGGKTLVQYFSAPAVVKIVCTGWLGVMGGILAMLGVVAAPITSGDTALRSMRLIIAEALHIDQKPIVKRLMISVPIFVATFALLLWQMGSPDSFNVLWQFFGWSNQTLSVFTFWMLTVYLVRAHKPYVMTLIPALFMTVICTLFLLVSPQAFNLGEGITMYAVPAIAAVALIWFVLWYRRDRARRGHLAAAA